MAGATIILTKRHRTKIDGFEISIFAFYAFSVFGLDAALIREFGLRNEQEAKDLPAFIKGNLKLIWKSIF